MVRVSGDPRLPVVLAAGLGSRLGGRPKALVPVHGRALLDRCADALAGAGFERMLVVTGHGADAVREHVRSAEQPLQVDFLHNDRYVELNNFHTLACACSSTDEPLLVLNCDVIFTQAALRGLLAADAPLALAVERGVVDAEAMKAAVRGGRVTGLGKHLSAAEAAGEFVGLSTLGADARAAYAVEAATALRRGETTLYYEDVYSRLCPAFDVRAVPVPPGSWSEIDEPADVAAAEAVADRRLPLVSVVVPTRDRPQLLDRALAGIFGQDYRGPIECVVVFDQSEPAPVGHAARPGRTLRLVVNDRTPGLAGARNTGALAARGRLLAFCDDDDEWLPQKLSRQVEELQRAPSADACVCGMLIRRGERESVRLPPPGAVTHRHLLRSRRVEVHPGTIVVRRDAFLERIGLVDEQIPGSYAEDYDWVLRAARARDLVALPLPLVRIHWHASSWFAGRWEMVAAALAYLLEHHPEFGSERKGLARIYGQLAFASAAAGRRRAAGRYARRCVGLSVWQPRAYLALLVAAGLPAAWIAAAARLVGRGI